MTPASAPRVVGWWLIAIALMVFIQVGLGGITRLTDSGLSITEWKPLLGVVPPHDDEGWAEAFANYQQIPQYRQLKSHLSLDAFRFIYFWEWLHRLWARLVGLGFVVPLVLFWRRRMLHELKGKLLALLTFGGLQGLLGWFMVASGLQDLLYVSHLRLAAHFLLAVLLLAGLLWVGLGVLRPPQGRLHRPTLLLLVLLTVQLVWGALMAGLKAALLAPTWPTINGAWVPGEVFTEAPWQHPLSVHFVHRTLAIVLLVLVAIWWWQVRRVLAIDRHVVLLLVALQVALGIATVLYAPYQHALLWLGLSHQLVGTALFVALVSAAQRTTLYPSRSVSASSA